MSIEVGYYGSKEKSRIEVMAIVKNYVMWRFKGCIPQVHSLKDFTQFLGKLQPTKL